MIPFSIERSLKEAGWYVSTSTRGKKKKIYKGSDGMFYINQGTKSTPNYWGYTKAEIKKIADKYGGL